MWAGVFTQPFLLLLFFVNNQTCDTGKLENKMVVRSSSRNIAVGSIADALDMEHESICCGCEQ